MFRSFLVSSHTETVVINNAPSHNDKHSQLLALDITQLRRPPLSSASSASMNGCQVTEGAVAGKSVLSCSANVVPANVVPARSLSDRDIDMPRAAPCPGPKRRGPIRRLTESALSRLIAEVIDSQPGKKALIRDIYQCLQHRAPDFFPIRGRGRWQGRVRRQLSRQKELFVKTSEKGPGGGDYRVDKGHYWQLQSDQATSLRVQSSTAAVPVSTDSRLERIT